MDAVVTVSASRRAHVDGVNDILPPRPCHALFAFRTSMSAG